jgi:hypothetical protein
MPDPRAFRHDVLELAARWYVFLFLNVYGVGKIVGEPLWPRPGLMG